MPRADAMGGEHGPRYRHSRARGPSPNAISARLIRTGIPVRGMRRLHLDATELGALARYVGALLAQSPASSGRRRRGGPVSGSSGEGRLRRVSHDSRSRRRGGSRPHELARSGRPRDRARARLARREFHTGISDGVPLRDGRTLRGSPGTRAASIFSCRISTTIFSFVGRRRCRVDARRAVRPCRSSRRPLEARDLLLPLPPPRAWAPRERGPRSAIIRRARAAQARRMPPTTGMSAATDTAAGQINLGGMCRR